MSVADGRSTVTVSAEVRDSAGNPAKDGTLVMFSTTIGSFRESRVPVYGGFARAILIAGSTPGVAKVSASCITMNATDVQEFEFVADRSILSAAQEYIELEGPQSLMYNVDLRTMAASGANQGVVLRFRDIEIHADDIQINVPVYQVRARKAKVKIGKTVAEFDELFFDLSRRKGMGTTTFTSTAPLLLPFSQAVRFDCSERRRYGIAEVRASGVSDPTETVDRSMLEFVDVSDATSMVLAKRAIAYPRKDIQFHHADVYVGGARIMRLPLYQVSMASSVLVTEQFFNINNSTIQVNYPYYVSLTPGFTSLFRFRTGESYGRGFTANRGAYLDYEMNWNRGDKMDGGLVLGGIGRSDWDLGIHQSVRPDDRTNAYVQGDLSGGRGLFGALGASRAFGNYNLSISGNSNHSLTGLPYSSDQASISFERNAVKVGRLPLSLSAGFAASMADTSTGYVSAKQSGFGLMTRLQMAPQRMDRSTTLTFNMSANSMVGQNTNGGFGLLASTSITRQLGTGSSMVLGYDFADDGFTSSVLGRHRMNLQVYAGGSRLNFMGMIQKSLDVARTSYLFDSSYRVNNLWRLSAYYTLDSYLGQSFQDYNIVISRRVGLREVGLVYSGTTNRFGIQIMGATFN